MVVLLATAGYDNTIRFWDPSSGHSTQCVAHPDKQVNCLEFSRDKQFLAAASNPSAKVYDVPSLSSSTTHHDPLYKLEGHTGNITSIGFQRDNKWVFTGSEDGTLRVWDMRASSQKCQRTYETPGAVNSVVLHPNQGELIAGDNAGIVTVWDLAADKCVNELPPADGGTAISSVSIAQDSSIFVSATYAGNCFFWDSRGASDSWTPIRQLQAHKTYILKCRLSPDAQYLATCSSDKTCKLWKISNFSLFNTFTGHSRWVWDCRFSADSNYLVTGSSDGHARLCDVESGDVVSTYSGHQKAIVTVALNDMVDENE